MQINAPKVDIAHRNTPIDTLHRLSAHLGGPCILMKRDDYTGFAMGGNKARKLEYLVADARNAGCDTLVTIGGVQSNHCRQTAAAAAKFGLACDLVLTRGALDTGEFMENGNVLLDRLCGATLHFVGDVQDKTAALAAVCDKVRERGGIPYAVPLGGSSAVGSLGYADALFEMAGQADLGSLAAIVTATGSAGTHAGLVAGAAALALQTPILGMSVSGSAEVLRGRIAALAAETGGLLGTAAPPAPGDIRVNDGHIGRGYGHPTDGCLEAISLLARLEGIFLDPVYTGKAMAGLVAMVRAGDFSPDDTVLFLHTGGAPGLFAYRAEVDAGRREGALA